MLSLKSDFSHLPEIMSAASAPALRVVQLFCRALETDPMLAASVVMTALLIAMILIWCISHQSTRSPGRQRKAGRQQFSLKGRAGQTIGSVQMSPHGDIDSFVEDLTALNQIVRGGTPGPGARLEVTQLKCFRDGTKEQLTQYSTFTGSLCVGMGCMPVQGLAKIKCRKGMIFPEVEFESEFGRFRIELPEVPKVLGSRTLKFNVDIGLGRRQTEA
jgi:hypothetical protein